MDDLFAAINGLQGNPMAGLKKVSAAPPKTPTSQNKLVNTFSKSPAFDLAEKKAAANKMPAKIEALQKANADDDEDDEQTKENQQKFTESFENLVEKTKEYANEDRGKLLFGQVKVIVQNLQTWPDHPYPNPQQELDHEISNYFAFINDMKARWQHLTKEMGTINAQLEVIKKYDTFFDNSEENIRDINKRITAFESELKSLNELIKKVKTKGDPDVHRKDDVYEDIKTQGYNSEVMAALNAIMSSEGLLSPLENQSLPSSDPNDTTPYVNPRPVAAIPKTPAAPANTGGTPATTTTTTTGGTGIITTTGGSGIPKTPAGAGTNTGAGASTGGAGGGTGGAGGAGGPEPTPAERAQFAQEQAKVTAAHTLATQVSGYLSTQTIQGKISNAVTKGNAQDVHNLLKPFADLMGSLDTAMHEADSATKVMYNLTTQYTVFDAAYGDAYDKFVQADAIFTTEKAQLDWAYEQYEQALATSVTNLANRSEHLATQAKADADAIVNNGTTIAAMTDTAALQTLVADLTAAKTHVEHDVQTIAQHTTDANGNKQTLDNLASTRAVNQMSSDAVATGFAKIDAAMQTVTSAESLINQTLAEAQARLAVLSTPPTGDPQQVHDEMTQAGNAATRASDAAAHAAGELAKAVNAKDAADAAISKQDPTKDNAATIAAVTAEKAKADAAVAGAKNYADQAQAAATEAMTHAQKTAAAAATANPTEQATLQGYVDWANTAQTDAANDAASALAAYNAAMKTAAEIIVPAPFTGGGVPKPPKPASAASTAAGEVARGGAVVLKMIARGGLLRAAGTRKRRTQMARRPARRHTRARQSGHTQHTARRTGTISAGAGKRRKTRRA